MKTFQILLIATCVFLLSFSANNESSISGTVKDKNTGEGIAFANISIEKNGSIVTGTTTDFNGNYTIKNIPPDIYDINASFLGYNTFKLEKYEIKSGQKHTLDFELAPTADALSDVVIYEHKVASIQYETNKIEIIEEAIQCLEFNYETPYIEHNTESYDYISENNFKNVLNDPLSTFSIDVDRASYSNVRRFLNNSSMPPVDAVRIEEMINYFDYDYKQPNGEHPFSTHIELGDCPWNQNNKLMLIGIQGESMVGDEVPPCNLVFLIDVSGSMYSAEKLPLLKKSFGLLIDQLRPQDYVSIVVYASSSGCVLPATSGNEKSKIREALNNLEAGGSTAGGAGIKLAYKIAENNFIENGNNRIILATDGDFNVGASSNSELERLIENYRDKGVFLTILGFGMGNYKDSKMENLSNKGNGNYAYIDNILEANKVFGHELWGTLYTIAKDVKIQIEFNPAKIKEYRLIGYENRLLNKEDFNNDKKDAGEIGSGHSVTALYELVLSDGKHDKGSVDDLNYQVTNILKSNDLMCLKIRYKNPNEETSKLIIDKITSNDIKVNNNSENFILASAVAEFGMLLRDSEYKEKSNYNNVLAKASQTKENDKYGYRSEFVDLVRKAKLLSKDK